jgi:hypothetical protein
LVAFAGDDYVETFIVSSWAEHLRQHERVTNADRAVEDRLRTYVTGVPTVRHFVVVVAVLAIRRFGMPPWWMWGGHDGSSGTGSGNGAD